MAGDAVARKIKEWLVGLAVLCATGDRADNVEPKINALVGQLRDLPIGAFTEASREYVARSSNFFPSYAVLREKIESWWSQNQPRPRCLPGEGDASLSEEDRIWLLAWETRSQSNAVPTKLLGLIRARSEAAYDRLVRTDPAAYAIAVARGWPTESRDARRATLAAEWSDAGVIIERVRAIRALGDDALLIQASALGLLRRMVEYHAPELLELVPAAVGHREPFVPARTGGVGRSAPMIEGTAIAPQPEDQGSPFTW